MLRPIALTALPLLLAQAANAQPVGEVGEHSDATIEASVLEPGPVTVGDDDAELAGLIALSA